MQLHLPLFCYSDSGSGTCVFELKLLFNKFPPLIAEMLRLSLCLISTANVKNQIACTFAVQPQFVLFDLLQSSPSTPIAGITPAGVLGNELV